MKNTGDKSTPPILRKKAEEVLKKRPPETGSKISEDDTRKLMHELEVHKIELELQNEELLLVNLQSKADAEKYTVLYDFAPSAYFTLSSTGKIIDLNLCGSQMLGKERSSLINRQFRFFISSKTKSVFDLFFRKAFDSKVKESCEVILSANRNLPMYVHLTAIVEEKVKQCFLTAVDITKRKLADLTLKESEERYRSLTQSANEAIITSDSKGIISGWNRGAEKIFGYSEEEATGKNLTLIIPQQYSSDHTGGIERFEKSDGHHIIDKTVEMHGIHKNGNAFPVELSLAMWETESGKFFTGIIRDITRRKQAEYEILKLNEELDLRVKQRTAELEEANKELEKFSYSISHDLHAPLRRIRGFIDLLVDNNTSEITGEQLKFMEYISLSANEMEKLIDAILSFSRLSRSQVQRTSIQTTKIVQQVIRLFENETQNRKITFNVEPLPVIQADEELIRQVWTNLISNAVKYTGKKPEAVIDIGSVSTPKDTTFYIKDNGAGFNMKYAEKLFGVFQRFHNTSNFEGVGIGLANVDRIVKRHGGSCFAESEVDKGATFYFSIPK